MSKTPEFLTHKEAAAFLGITRQTLNRWHREGFIPAARQSGARRIHRVSDLVEAIKHNCLIVSPEARKAIQ